ncbi:MAG: EfeM/EfeO family lipoprotein [Anaerolineae bacterium]|nr:EfeM/EfeO family lipoprotein [Anaerolineae bacterium]
MKRMLWIGLLMGLFVLPMGLFAQETTDVGAIKTYLMTNVTALQTHATRLEQAALDYYNLAETAGFDYAALWSNERVETSVALLTAKDAWLIASPLYEQVEGVVAGVPLLSQFDVELDAGVSGAEDPEGGVRFNLTLRDGRTLERPGNLFGVLESTLWGTREAYTTGVRADLNLNSSADFGETLPDAALLLAAAETFRATIDDLYQTAEGWTPTVEDAFTALVVMVPTMSEYFGSWRESRFVAGDDATQAEFVVISRLADIRDILGGLIVIYDSVSPLIEGVDPAQNSQIRQDLIDLQTYVNDLYTQEQEGRVFTPEEADLFGNEAQGRAQGIAGQIAQIAALLNIALPE